MKVPVPLYGGAPPEAVTVTAEVPPLQAMRVALEDAPRTGGSVIVTVAVAVQLFASVTVKEYVPALLVNEPVPVYGGVPPEAVTVTAELPPLQAIAVAAAVALTTDGSVIVTVVIAVQLFASVTVKEYMPAGRVNVPVPVSGGVPPEAETVTLELPPLHAITVALDDATKTGGSVIVTVVVAVQLLASVTVNV